jgi:hypothetical protein
MDFCIADTVARQSGAHLRSSCNRSGLREAVDRTPSRIVRDHAVWRENRADPRIGPCLPARRAEQPEAAILRTSPRHRTYFRP